MAGMYSKMAAQKIGKVMKEGMAGKLHAGKAGPIVKEPRQMKAIALSVARKRGLKVPAPKPGMNAMGRGKGRMLGGLEKRLARKKF